jgi:PAS domain S-box-containing protein
MAFGNYIPDQHNPPLTLQVEEELEFAKFLVNHVADAAFWLGSDARFLYVNDVSCRKLGYCREELLSLTMHDVDPDLPKEAWSEQWRSLKQQGSLTFESRHRTKAGQIFPVEIAVTYVEYHGREFSCAFAREKSAEVEIRATIKQTKQLSLLRARFVSMLCHELRTPLNIVSFSTSLLRRHNHQWTEEKKLRYLDHIQTAVEQIGQLLDEVLTVSKAEAGKLKFEPRPLDLAAFCYNLVAQMQLMSNSSQHAIAFVIRGNCSTARVDKKLLQLILTNLLDNAIKYSPPASTVDLEISCSHGDVIFHVKDTGIGIPIADRQRLFEPFHRGSNVGDVAGTGLGLAVVKKLVDLHCGQIAVESVVGVGTTFTVTLPYSRRDDEKNSGD